MEWADGSISAKLLACFDHIAHQCSASDPPPPPLWWLPAWRHQVLQVAARSFQLTLHRQNLNCAQALSVQSNSEYLWLTDALQGCIDRDVPQSPHKCVYESAAQDMECRVSYP